MRHLPVSTSRGGGRLPARWVSLLWLAFWLLGALLAGGVGAATIPSEAGPPAPQPTLPIVYQRARAPSYLLDSLLQATPTLEQLSQQLDAAWNAQNWPLALQLIDQIIAIDPNYDDIQTKHYYAHVNYGYELLTAGQCSASYSQFQQALAVRPAGEEALKGLDLLKVYCPTPAPGVTPSATTAPGPATATLTPISIISPAPTLTVSTPVPIVISAPITYTVQPGDTLYSLSKRYSTTVQAIMQANGLMSYFLRAGAVIWIPASGAPPPGPVVHIVQPGETLASIARQYNTTVWAIMSANGMSTYAVYAFQALFIPTIQQPGPIIHIVMPGETLYTIALRYDKTVTELMMANGLRSYEITVYQQVVIPPEGWTGWPIGWPGNPASPLPPFGAQRPVNPPPPAPRLYTVKPGDTLFGIATKFGTTVQAIKAANGLTGSTIYAGTKLKIP